MDFTCRLSRVWRKCTSLRGLTRISQGSHALIPHSRSSFQRRGWESPTLPSSKTSLGARAVLHAHADVHEIITFCPVSAAAPSPAPAFSTCALCALDSLFQAPRSEHEALLFPVGLKASNIWYSHHDSIAWLQPELPMGLGAKLQQLGLASTYEDSGWCYVELASSAIVKKKGGRLDLSMRGSQESGTYKKDWKKKWSVVQTCEKKRTPPILPDDMKMQLETVKKFTSKGDVSSLRLMLTPAWCVGVGVGVWAGRVCIACAWRIGKQCRLVRCVAGARRRWYLPQLVRARQPHHHAA